MDTQKYWQDSKGRLVPFESIKEIDRLRDSLVKEKIEKAKLLQAQIKAFKEETSNDLQAFIQLSGEKYGVNLGGNKGNTSLITYDGKQKIQIAIGERIAFDERIQAAKSLIDDCLKDWTEASNREIRTLVGDAFRVDKEGNINAKEVLKLKRYDFTDERWQRAMHAISDSVYTAFSKQYLRFYEADIQGNFENIVLDIANA